MGVRTRLRDAGWSGAADTAIVFPTVAELILSTENAILIVIAAIAAVLFFVFSFIFICVGTLLIIAGAAVFAVRWTKVRPSPPSRAMLSRRIAAVRPPLSPSSYT